MSAGSLYQRLRQTAEESSALPAMTFLRPRNGGTVTYTFGELFERAESIGDRLARRSVDASAPLGLLMASQEDQVLHYLAGLSAGAVPAILTPPNRKLNRQYYQQTMNAVLRRCHFGAVVTDVDGIELSTVGFAPYTLERREGAQRTNPDPAVAPEPLDASFLQFSSGTTGIKRGVLVTDRAVLSQIEVYAKALGLDQSDRVLSWLPLYHDMGFIACLNMPLALGVHTVMMDPIDWVSNPAAYLRAVDAHRATVSWHPNFAYAFMATRVRDSDVGDADLSSLRALVNCSEPVTQSSQRAFSERFRSFGLEADVFRGCYAMAETTFALTHGEPTDDGFIDPVGPTDGARVAGADEFVSVGSPLPGVELRIVDPQTLEPLPDRAVGEIWVQSPFNFSGYYNDHNSTQGAFVAGWYRTGDLGYRAGSAYYVTGRLKDLLIVGGVNVFPQDIEELVSGVEGIKSGRVSAFSDFDERLQTEQVVILAETDCADPAETRQIVQNVRQRVLAAFQIANFGVHLRPEGWLVKSSSGKMARSANRDKWKRASTV